MLNAWTVTLVGTAVLAAAIVPGVWLWWPMHGNASSRSELGVALLTGTLVASAVLVVQIMFEVRLNRIEDQRQAAVQRAADRQSLSLTVGMQRDLRGIDLRGRDLSGFFLARRDLADGQLAGTRLEDAYLAEANLLRADLRDAHLAGANLDDSRLEEAILTGADLRGASLRGARLRDADLSQADLRGAVLTGASLAGTSLGDARYDARTQWPQAAGVRPCAASRVCAYG